VPPVLDVVGAMQCAYMAAVSSAVSVVAGYPMARMLGPPCLPPGMAVHARAVVVMPGYPRVVMVQAVAVVAMGVMTMPVVMALVVQPVMRMVAKPVVMAVVLQPTVVVKLVMVAQMAVVLEMARPVVVMPVMRPLVVVMPGYPVMPPRHARGDVAGTGGAVVQLVSAAYPAQMQAQRLGPVGRGEHRLLHRRQDGPIWRPWGARGAAAAEVAQLREIRLELAQLLHLGQVVQDRHVDA
jgi:hypothetical protein